MPPSTTSFEVDGIQHVIRDIRPSDFPMCNVLEQRAAQGSRFFRVAFVHYKDYDTRAKLFERHRVIVVERQERSAPVIVGVVHVGFKSVWVRNSFETAAYIFDLRVDESFRRLGLGRRLMEISESTAISAGAAFMYLTVNGDNRGALALYDKMAYQELSRRSLAFSPLLPAMLSRWTWRSATCPSDVACSITAGAASRAVVHRLLGSVPLAPRGLNALFDDSEYFVEGVHLTHAASGSEAFVGLNDTSSLNGVELTRVVLPVATLASPLGKALMLASALALLYGGCRLTLGALRLGGLFGLLLSTLLLMLWALVFIIAAFVAGRWGHAWKIRAFVPAMAGPRGPELLRLANRLAAARAERAGFAAVLMNTGQGDRFAEALGRGRSERAPRFLIKSLREGLDASGLGAGPDGIFFDPRDL